MLWYWRKFAWDISESNSCRVWGSNKDSWRKKCHGRRLPDCFVPFLLTRYVFSAQGGQADWWAEPSLPQIILMFKVANAPPDYVCCLMFLSKVLSHWRIFFLNSILSANVIVPLCRQSWSLWVHLGPWDSSLINGRFRIRQGIRTSAINPEKGNARFIWLLACDLWMC